MSVSDFTVEEQNRWTELLWNCIQLISHISADQRSQLCKIIVPESIECVCGKYLLPSEKFCSNCHRFVEKSGVFIDAILCPACGAYLKSTAHFCNKCGHNMVENSILSNSSLENRSIDVTEVSQTTENVNSDNATTCPSCGKEVASGKKFCKFCGAKMDLTDHSLNNISVEINEQICSNCGNSVKPGKKFCPKCGAKILK